MTDFENFFQIFNFFFDEKKKFFDEKMKDKKLFIY